MRRLSLLLVLLCLGTAPGMAGKLGVSSFSAILTEIAQEVGGDRVEVTGHVKPGIDPHDFEPRPADLKAVSSADLILLSAKQLEGYVGKLREAAGARAAILEVGNKLPALPPVAGAAAGAGQGEDPHWWHSTGNIRKATEIIRDEFIRLRPEDREAFAAGAARYLGRLAVLEKWVKSKVAELPTDRRKLVTNHDSFGYFAREFGFTVYPIAGISKNDQPGSKKVAAIIATIRAQGVKAIFSETSENPKVIGQITRETGARIGGELFADGPGAGEAGGIEGMFRHNVTVIVEGLK